MNLPPPSPKTKKIHKILYIVILMTILYCILFYLDILNYLSLENVVSVILGFLIMIIVQLRFISYYFQEKMRNYDLDQVGVVKDFIKNRVFGEININYIQRKQKQKYYQHTKDQNDRLFADQNQETFECVMAVLRAKKSEGDQKSRGKIVQEKWDIFIAKMAHFETFLNNLLKVFKEKSTAYRKFLERTIVYKDQDFQKWKPLFSYPVRQPAELDQYDTTNWLELKRIIYMKHLKTEAIAKQISGFLSSDFNIFTTILRNEVRQVVADIQISQSESSGTKKTYRDIMQKIKTTNEKINTLVKKINQKTKGSQNTEQIFKTEYDLRFLRIEMDNLEVRRTYTKDMMIKNSENHYKLCLKKENLLEEVGIKKLNNKIWHYIVLFFEKVKTPPEKDREREKELKRSRKEVPEELLNTRNLNDKDIKLAREDLNQYYRRLNQFRYYLGQLTSLTEEQMRSSKKITDLVKNYDQEWKARSAQFRLVHENTIGERIVDSMFMQMLDSINNKDIEVMSNFIAHLKQQHSHIPRSPRLQPIDADLQNLRFMYNEELSSRMSSSLPGIITLFLHADRIIMKQAKQNIDLVELRVKEMTNQHSVRARMNEYKDEIFRLEREEESRRDQGDSDIDDKQRESSSLEMINRILDAFASEWRNSDFFHEILKEEIEVSLNTKRPPFLSYMSLKYIKIHEKEPNTIKNLTILGDNIFVCNFEVEIDFKGKIALQIETEIKNNKIPIEIKLLLTKFKCPLRICFTPFALGKSNVCMMKTPELEAEYSAKLNGYELTKIPFLSLFIELFIVIKLRKKFLHPKKATIKVPMAVKNAISEAIKQRVNFQKLMQKKKKSD